MLASSTSASLVVSVSSNIKRRSRPYQLVLGLLFFWCECLPFEPPHLVQTAHVNSLPATYGRHGSDPHTPSTGYSKAPLLLRSLPWTYSGLPSTQMNSVECLSPRSAVIRYPWYSLVHPDGQSFLAGIISIEPRDLTKQTAQGASWSCKFLSKGFPLYWLTSYSVP